MYTYDTGDPMNERNAAQCAAAEADMSKALYTWASSARSNQFCGNTFPLGERRVYEASLALLKACRSYDALLNPCLAAIGKLGANLNHWQATYGAIEAALEVATKDYFDVVRSAGPEPGRRSDNLRPLSTKEWCVLHLALREMHGKLDHPSGTGWVLDAICRKHNVGRIA